eukprot:2023551-Ditylum_brightwellii.AAC.1
MKRAWREDLLHVFSPIEEYVNSDDDGMSCLMPLQALQIIGGSDKVSVPVGRKLLYLQTAKQYFHALIPSDGGHSPQAADHDWHSEAMAVSVIHGMNRSADSCASFYSCSVDGNGHVTVSIHYQISDASTEMKHAVHYLQYLLHQTRKASNSVDEEELK